MVKNKVFDVVPSSPKLFKRSIIGIYTILVNVKVLQLFFSYVNKGWWCEWCVVRGECYMHKRRIYLRFQGEVKMEGAWRKLCHLTFHRRSENVLTCNNELNNVIFRFNCIWRLFLFFAHVLLIVLLICQVLFSYFKVQSTRQLFYCF